MTGVGDTKRAAPYGGISATPADVAPVDVKPPTGDESGGDADDGGEAGGAEAASTMTAMRKRTPRGRRRERRKARRDQNADASDDADAVSADDDASLGGDFSRDWGLIGIVYVENKLAVGGDLLGEFDAYVTAVHQCAQVIDGRHQRAGLGPLDGCARCFVGVVADILAERL